MQKLTAVIIDDEFPGRENLKNLIVQYCSEISIIGEASNGAEGRKTIMDLNPDIVFLDIYMPDMSGFDLVNSISNRNFYLIFQTAFSDFGIQAVNCNAAGYLLKPISISSLQQTVKRVIEVNEKRKELSSEAQYGRETEKIIIPQFQGFQIVESKEIVRLEGSGNYTKLVLISEKEITCSKTLKDFEEILCRQQFIRVHKSHIINLAYLKEFTNLEGGFVFLADGSKLEISRRRMREFIQKTRQFVNVK